MAIVTGNGFASKRINSEIVSALSMVKKDNALGYYKAFGNLASDSVVAQLEASGAVDRVGTEDYSMHFQNSKDRNKFKVEEDVEITNSGAVTLTVSTYADDGETLSAPEEGLFFRENSSGIEFQVNSVVKSAVGAHTVTLSPTTKGITETIPASDAEFISVGRPTVQEASFQQAGESKSWAKRENFIRIIRTNKNWTDLVTMLEVEQTKDGRTFYDLDRSEMSKEHIDVKEIELMMGDVRDNVTSTGNRNSQGKGFIPLVQEFGTAIDGSGSGATLDKALFRQIARAIDGNGLSTSYNGLADSEAMYKIQDFLSTANVTIQNANATGDELKAIFDYNTNFVFDGIDYSFKKYNYWNAQRLAGADVDKSFLSNQILLMPNGTYTNSEGFSQPFMQLRYLDNNISTDEGLFNKLDLDGAIFGQGTTREAMVSMTTYMGADIMGVEGFQHIRLAR